MSGDGFHALTPLGRCPGSAQCCARGRLCGLAVARYGVLPRIEQLPRGERPAGADGRLVVRSLHSGLAALCAALPDGRRQIARLIAPGDMLSGCTAPGAQCWVEALAPSSVCVVDLSAHAERAHADSEFLGALARTHGSLLEATIARIVALGRLDGTERVIAFLAEMTTRLGQADGNGWRVPLPLTREDIADYLGLKPETIIRILGRIKREGLALFPCRTEFRVPDLDVLAARSPLPAPVTDDVGSGCPLHAGEPVPVEAVG